MVQEELLTFKEVMHWLRVSRSTLNRMIEAGQLRGHKVGSTWRFYPQEVRRLIIPQEGGADARNHDHRMDSNTEPRWLSHIWSDLEPNDGL